MPHPDEGLIHEWLDGELDATEAARVERLVASDPEWAAAAAEARGFLAASARIVGSLDRVPANVIPKPAAAPPRSGGRWLLRAAAIVVLIGGSAVVLNRAPADSGVVTIPLQRPAAAPVIPSAPPVTPPAPALARARNIVPKSNTIKKELDEQKQQLAVAGKDRNVPATESRADAAPAPMPQGALKKAQAFAEDKTTRLQPVCFLQREPRDSAGHLILLDRDALADSIRLERLTQRGDTLAAVNGRLRAVRAPCPAP